MLEEEKALSYVERVDAEVRDLLLEFDCQPILFVGSGLSRRYFDAPAWEGLLEKIADIIPSAKGRFEYFKQKHDSDLIKVGSDLAGLAFEWAWLDGRDYFPEELFASGVNRDAYLKYMVCKILNEITPTSIDEFSKFEAEIKLLQAVKPHAVITTNYDLALEVIFDGYATVTGQTIIRYNTNSFGEIFHIHGDVSEYNSIVLTDDDYKEWNQKKKYISAKLLTYFAEHPIFIIGYGLGDPNVKSILKDIGEIVADSEGMIQHVYQIVWHETMPRSPSDQTVFAVDGKEFRIKAIHVDSYKRIFGALKSKSALTSVNPKLVRALAARTMKLIRNDIPSGSVDVNYDVLERISGEDSELPKLLGITISSNPNHSHPLTITQVANRLGYRNWSGANKLINKIKEDKGVDLRSSDNLYHCQIKTGNASKVRKWSLVSVDLLRKVRDNEPYEIEL